MIKAKYNTETGEITGCAEVHPPHSDLPLAQGEDWLVMAELIRPRDYYVLDGKLAQRVTVPLNAEDNLITGIPVGSRLLIGGIGEFLTEAEQIVLDIPPGDYVIRVIPSDPQYRPTKMTIEVK
jgi:hypothetical protein